MKEIPKELQVIIAWIAFLRTHKEETSVTPENFKAFYEEELEHLDEDKHEKLRRYLAAMPDVAKTLIVSRKKTFGIDCLNSNKLLSFLQSSSLHELKTCLSDLYKQLQRVEILERDLSFIKDIYLKDDLTQLWNRNGLKKYFSQVVEPNVRDKNPFVLFFFDLDEFKKINDEHGHEIGDRALKHFADFLVINFRSDDFLARVYGDEFAAVPALISAEDALRKAESIVSKDCSMKVRDKSIHIKFSVGFTIIRENDTLKDALVRADESMYIHKKTKKILLN